MSSEQRSKKGTDMRKMAIIIGLPLVVMGCSDTSYTLYRSSAIAEMRIHVASFDAADGEGYNNENCRIAAELFAEQPGVTVRYWCEKGRFKS